VSRRARSVIAASIFATTAVSLGLAGPAQAHSALGQQGALGRQGALGQQGGDLPVSLAITSVTPAYASPGQTVTVSGSITNTSSAVISGISVRLRSSSTAFESRDALQEYANGNEPQADGYVPGATTRKPIELAAGGTEPWSVALRVNKVGMTSFGVYPLAAEADSASDTALPGGTSLTFLPFWPAKHGAPRPQPQEIAWILPIIDQPLQGPCPVATLLNNSLAASLAPGGRLSSLLAAGQAESASTQLTWAIDPSLLRSVQAMTHPYRIGGNADCVTGYRTLPASHAAADWLAGLKHVTADQGVFVTPYADVDIAALTRESLDSDLVRAFAQGRSVAGSILGRNFSPASAARPGQAAATEALNGMAWPADGLANRAVLQNLAANKVKVSAVILASSTMLPVSGSFAADSAVTSTPNGVTGDTRVLLADDTITQILGSANSPSDPAGATFAVRQRFLAETAMIAAQAPNAARSIVVAPPRRWNPPAGLADSLLAETASAPWLKPVSIGQLATAKLPPGQPVRTPPTSTAKGELSRHLLRQIKGLDRRIAPLESIRVQPDPSLSLAVASVESSAWRGAAGGREAQVLLNRVSGYATSQEQALSITRPLPVTMGGLKGSPPVSISSHLDYPVKVRLEVSVPAGAGMIIRPPGDKVIPPDSVVNIKLNVHAATVGSTTIRLALLAPDGTALPGPDVTMTIRATQFGTLALVILAAALGVFMITSAARAIRQGGATHKTGPSSSGPDATDGTGDPGAAPDGEAAPDGSVAGDHAEQQAGQQAAGRAEQQAAGRARNSADHDPTEETDELAGAPGRADKG
jgi:hypothetical protein